MAILECTKDGDCKCISASVIRCAKAMKIVQRVNPSSGRPAGPRRIRLLGDVTVKPGDMLRIGLRSFSAVDDDIVLREMDDGRVQVTVLRNDQIVLQRIQNRDVVKFVPADGTGSISLRAALEDEEDDAVSLDLQDLRDRDLL